MSRDFALLTREATLLSSAVALSAAVDMMTAVASTVSNVSRRFISDILTWIGGAMLYRSVGNFKKTFELHRIHQNLTGLAAVCRADDSGSFELVHDLSGAVISD